MTPDSGRWDVFRGDRLEVVRDLSAADVRAARAAGEVADDDLIRPAGSTEPWARLADFAHLLAAPPTPTPTPTPASPAPDRPVEVAPAAPAADVGGAAEVPGSAFGAVFDDDDDDPRDSGVESLLGLDFAEEPGEADSGPMPTHRDVEGDSAAFRTMVEPADDDPGSIPGFAPLGPRPATTEDIGADPLGPDSMAEVTLSALIDDDEGDDDDLSRFSLDPPSEEFAARRGSPGVVSRSVEALPVAGADDDFEPGPGPAPDPGAEDEAAAEFTLARGGPETVEELDLAAMVDVAFQLVLFFLVTASTLVYKTLEVPKPKPEDAPGAASQGATKPDDLMETYILVEVDPSGALKVDHEPAPSDPRGLADRLRAARAQAPRFQMLLMADSTTPHRSAVLAYDAAAEVGLGIAIARPKPPVAPPPTR